MVSLFTYTLIQVLIMLVLSAGKKRAAKSEKKKPQTEFVRNKRHYSRSGNNCVSTRTYCYTNTPKDKHIIQILIHPWRWRHIQSITAASKPSSHLTDKQGHWYTCTHLLPRSFHLQHTRSLDVNPQTLSHTSTALIHLSIYSFICIYISCQRSASCCGWRLVIDWLI